MSDEILNQILSWALVGSVIAAAVYVLGEMYFQIKSKRR